VTDDRRRDAWSLAILALVPALLFIDVLLGIKGFYAGDVSQFYVPAKKVLREIVLGGEFPYWNPFFSGGQPMAANPEHAVFYPLNWLILLPDYVLGYQFLTLLHVFLATFAMYALLRSMELGRPASCFGALSYSIGGLSCSVLMIVPYIFNLAWLPLTCLYARRYLLRRRATAFAGAVICLGLQVVIGEPVIVLQTGLLLGCYAIYRGARDQESWAVARRVATIGLISCVAILLAAVQILPALDHLQDSVRGSRGLAYENVRAWSTPPVRFAEAFYPDILGRFEYNGTPAYWGSTLYGAKRVGYFSSIYAGVAVAILSLAGVFARVRGWPLFLTVVAIAAIAAAGDHTPLLRALYDAGVTTVRFPEKFLIMAVFTAIVFSAHVLDSLLRGEERTRKAAVAVALGVSAIAFLAAATTTTAAHTWLFRALFQIDPRQPVDVSLALARTGWLVAGLKGMLALILFRNILWGRRAVWLTFFAAFVAVDLAPQVPRVAPRITLKYYREIPAPARRLPSNRDEFRILHLANWQPGSQRQRLYSRPGPEAPWILRNSLAPRQPASFGLRTVIDGDYDETNLQPERDFAASFVELAASSPRDYINIVAAMSNAWYLGVYQKPEEAIQAAGGWNRNLEPVKFLEGRHHPRYYFASQIVSIRDRHDFVRRLQTLRYSRQAAFIHGPAFEPASGTVRSVQESSNGARIDLDASGRSFLVMSVTPHKYWRVTIDGKETPALITNIGYQGVVVPAGRHLVETRYRNPLIAVGGWVSIVTLLVLAVLILRQASEKKTGGL